MCIRDSANIEPFLQSKSSIPIISRLNILLPKASPAARSAPLFPPIAATELIPIPNSGNQVAVAKSTTPTNDLPNPVLNAITSADFVSWVAATNMITARIAS